MADPISALLVAHGIDPFALVAALACLMVCALVIGWCDDPEVPR